MLAATHAARAADIRLFVDEAMSNIQRTLRDGAFGVDAILAGQPGDGDPERAQRAGHQLERGE